MPYFDSQKNVEAYIKMADGYDGRELITRLRQHLPKGSTVLELGMGPGKDLDILAETYTVTGSDSSSVFLEIYRKTHPTADLLRLDAAHLNTERTFDCLYSNKVLHHLTKADIRRSFNRQYALLTDGGLLLHSFWYGDTEEVHHGLRFIYYTKDTLLDTVGTSNFELVETARYKEMEKGDSFYLLLRKGKRITGVS